MEERKDAELVQLARRGNKQAFDTLAQRYEAMARRVAVKMLADKRVADKLAQEAILQAYLSLQELRDPSAFSSWLYGIVLNLCRSFIRGQKTELYFFGTLEGGLRLDAVAWSGASASPEEIVQEREFQSMVLAAVNNLPVKEREAALLFYYEGLSLQEISTVLGASVGAIKARLYKSRNRLREGLLPIYEEMTSRTRHAERGRNMIQARVADVVKREHRNEQGETQTLYIVVLVDEQRKRALPIWVGPFEGQAIAMGIKPFATVRPMTYNFIASLLNAAGVKVEQVRIETLQNDTFYAIVRLENGETSREVDARPSDAIALAVRMQCPILIAEDVLQRGGAEIPASAQAADGKGIEGILHDLEETMRPRQTAPAYPRSPEEFERAKQELVASVFGSADKI